MNKKMMVLNQQLDAGLLSPQMFFNQLESLGLNPAHHKFDINQAVSMMRNATVLRKDQWEQLDAALVEVMKARLVGVADLVSRGLTLPLGGLGITMSEYETVTEMTAANVDMSGEAQGQEDRLNFNLVQTPIPIIHKDFRLSARVLDAGNNGPGAPLDTLSAERAMRKVAEMMDEILFNGSSVKVNATSIFGYTTQTNRSTGTISNAWDGASGTPVADVLDMLEALYGDNAVGPFILYVPKAYQAPLLADFKSESDKTILQRILEIPDIEAVRTSDRIDDEVVMVQMTRDVVDWAIGQDVTTIQWGSPSGFTTHFKVFTAAAPRVKSDSSSQSGIAHWSE